MVCAVCMSLCLCCCVWCRQVTLFKSVGTAVQDVATAFAVYEAALKDHVGLSVDMNA